VRVRAGVREVRWGGYGCLACACACTNRTEYGRDEVGESGGGAVALRGKTLSSRVLASTSDGTAEVNRV
jgi:hypothetical protein